MKWIKYQIEQSVIDGQPILIEKKVGYNATNLVIAQTEAYNGKYTIEEDGEIFDEPLLSVDFASVAGVLNRESTELKQNILASNCLYCIQYVLPEENLTFIIYHIGNNRVQTLTQNGYILEIGANGTLQLLYDDRSLVTDAQCTIYCLIQ